MNNVAGVMRLTCLPLSGAAEVWQAALEATALGPVGGVTAAQVQAPAEVWAQAPASHLVVVGQSQAVEVQLLAWQQAGPLAGWGPVTVLADGPLPQHLPSLVAACVQGWWPSALRDIPGSLAVALAVDRARWDQERQLRLALQATRQQLDERKWVERAKGVLMQAQGGEQALAEGDAFRLLRGAAMRSGLRVGEVSRSVIESAQWAEAINRAGQLRMLSQRLVKLAAQRLAGVDARRARTLQHQATQRAQDNLDHLASLPALVRAESEAPGLRGPLQQTLTAWAALKAALDQRQSPAMLAQTDADAEALLVAAEQLTDALEVQGGRQALRIINLCGRQRMRVQRLAKTALLADLLAEPSRHDALVPLLDEFEATLQELERAPLSSAEIRHNLGAARDEWLRLLRGLRATSGPGGTDYRAALAGSADALLDLFDQLTAAYEHSLQVIMA